MHKLKESFKRISFKLVIKKFNFNSEKNTGQIIFHYGQFTNFGITTWI